jgi:hypothetical protein
MKVIELKLFKFTLCSCRNDLDIIFQNNEKGMLTVCSMGFIRKEFYDSKLIPHTYLPSFALIMVGRPKSMAEKAMFSKQEHDDLMERAVQAYLAELEKPYRSRRGLRTICRDFEQLYLEEKGDHIHLSFATLGRLASGHHSRSEANEHRRWLTPIEDDIIVAFSIEIGARGFPLSHRRLKEHVDRIARARLGDKFPTKGVSIGLLVHWHAWVINFPIKV